MTLDELALDRARRLAEFARRGFYAKKAGAANKASGKKHIKGSTPKGVCGPGGGRACHKNYRAARGTDARKALAAEARAARAASRGGAAGATAAARAAAAKEGRGKAIGRLVGKSKEGAAVRERKSVERERAARRAAKVGDRSPGVIVGRAQQLKAQIGTDWSRAKRQRDKKGIARAEKNLRRVGAVESKAQESLRKAREPEVKARAKAYDERVRKEQAKAARAKPLGRIVAKSKEATRAAVPVARAKAREEKKARTAARRAELKPMKGKVDRAEIARQAREYRSMQLRGGKAGKATNEEIRRVIKTYAAPKGTAVSKAPAPAPKAVADSLKELRTRNVADPAEVDRRLDALKSMDAKGVKAVEKEFLGVNLGKSKAATIANIRDRILDTQMSNERVQGILSTPAGTFPKTLESRIASAAAPKSAAAKGGRGKAVGRIVARSKGAAATAADVKQLQAKVDRKRKEARAAIRKAEAAKSEEQKLRDRIVRAQRGARAEYHVRASFAEPDDDGGHRP